MRQETKDKISKSMIDYHASGLRSLKKIVRRIKRNVWKEKNNPNLTDTSVDDLSGDMDKFIEEKLRQRDRENRTKSGRSDNDISGK